jgi:hypothetical protein
MHISHKSSYHGNVSSASTGRFAALRFPLVFILSELNLIVVSTAGASTSISSSRSDIVVDGFWGKLCRNTSMIIASYFNEGKNFSSRALLKCPNIFMSGTGLFAPQNNCVSFRSTGA